MEKSEGAAPCVVFVCRRNRGKSQLAAALMRAATERDGVAVEVVSAGTEPGEGLNEEAVAALGELGVGVGDEHPKSLTDEMLARADLVVVLGTEARVEAREGLAVETWVTDEPSLRGIHGEERMRLVRDDIGSRVEELLLRLTG
ncbi:low molecular weight phosphatase family protein [Herbiconiux sp. KACC 21604]|uniref:arsenate-mycothiol transferase ArsC n=1 Tax=unclassified Herbiconiux TaxID=2618217 RepID=UPI001C0FA253|nr:low molecular weight phosphatase family protein [Herbiconiux sp. SALV-R1]WPO85265.1 low molecular weight phosphatase family protein [Herbiconiux sp. KACC 21604]